MLTNSDGTSNKLYIAFKDIDVRISQSHLDVSLGNRRHAEAFSLWVKTPQVSQSSCSYVILTSVNEPDVVSKAERNL